MKRTERNSRYSPLEIADGISVHGARSQSSLRTSVTTVTVPTPIRPIPTCLCPIPSHLNHSWASNAKPQPSDPLVSQQRTPEHSDSLASSQHIPDPTHLRPFLSLVSSWFLTPTLIPDPTLIRPFLFLASSWFPTTILIPDPTPFDLLSSCIKSIPDVSLVLRLQSGKARLCTSLARCVLVHLSSLPIYMFLYVPLSHHSLPSRVAKVQFSSVQGPFFHNQNLLPQGWTEPEPEIYFM